MSAAMRVIGSLPGLAAAALAAAWVLLALDVPPVPTWFYVFAWYPTLVLLDAVAFRRNRTASLFARPGIALSLLAWSPVVWLVFEVFNFRLQNWYYVSLPGLLVERWAGIVLSFATVVPAIVLAEGALAAVRVFAAGRGPTVAVREWYLHAATALGLVATALVLIWPRWFFPLVWGIGWVMAEPVVYRGAPALSLFRDLERGDWGRIGRLLLGGLGIGLLWESYNHVARGRWIYTVPGLEDLKLFEMPPLGFLGFPVFALAAWSMYGALCALGVAVPAVVGAGGIRRGRVVVAGLLAAAFTVGALAGMDHFTVSSTVPRPAELAALGPEGAALAGLRGMGVTHARALSAAGVTRVCDLPERDPAALAAAVRAVRPGPRPTEAEVRVWVRAARRICAARLDLSRHEAVTLASIIEGEGGDSTELAVISWVYHNHLARGVRLEADPTVVYARGSRTRLYNTHYGFDSPYNTYQVTGLPPGPIGQPSPASILAALHPAETEYLYFVATGDGRHAFSRTYREHLATVRRIRKP